MPPIYDVGSLSGMDVGGMAEEVGPSHQYPHYMNVAMWQTAAEGQPQMVADVEVQIKLRGGIELSFGIGKEWFFWISRNPDKPLTLTAALHCWAEDSDFPSGQGRQQSFSCNMMMPVINWSLYTTEQTASPHRAVLPCSVYSAYLVPSDFHPFRLMKDGLCGWYFPSSTANIAAVKQWVSSDGVDFYKYGSCCLA